MKTEKRRTPASKPASQQTSAAAAAPAREVVRIAIVGGGCAGMAAAWELCRNNLAPDATVFYDITVYEKSTLLGGKGSSFRDTQGRIREHGLHIWLGFYENAFRMMREAYAEAGLAGMGPDAPAGQRLPFGSFEDAFAPESHVGVASQSPDGGWEAWSGYLPPMAGTPGDPLDAGTNPFSLTAYLARCVALSFALMNSMVGKPGPLPGVARPDERSVTDEARELADQAASGDSTSNLIARMAAWLDKGLLLTGAGVLQGATIAETWLRGFSPLPGFDSTVLRYLETLATQVRKLLRKYVGADPQMRRKTEVIDLIMTIVVGLYRDRVLFDQERGLDAIDDIDCKDWLLKHGALRTSVESPFVTGLYDLAFCYRDGDREKPALAAGQGLRGALRMFFSYRGSIFWRMAGGMGETVFSPLHRVLSSSSRFPGGIPVTNPFPVKFRLAHRLDEIVTRPDADGRPRVTELRFTKEHEVADALDAFGCWPAPPDQAPGSDAVVVGYRQKAGDRRADAFDGVVLALAIDDLRTVVAASPRCALRDDPAWTLMFSKLKTVATQAAQVWLRKELPALGWTRGPVLISGYEVPLETWADMTHTLPTEMRWRRQDAGTAAGAPADEARTVIYFCGVLPDATIAAIAKTDPTDAAQSANVQQSLEKVLRTGMKPFWPLAYEGSTGLPLLSDRGLLVGGIADQHWRANWHGSERYTLALPGTARYRLSPLEKHVANMTIAGDWTACGFNEGCVEAAVMSGMLAAHAIAGAPALEAIIGYDHP